MKNIGELIRIERLKRGFSQEYVAQNLNMSQQAYSKIEKKPHKACFETILKIVSILEIDLKELQTAHNNKLH